MSAAPVNSVYGYVKNCLFVNLDTVAAFASPADMPEVLQVLWDHKAKQLDPTGTIDPLELYRSKAPFYAEFSKVAALGLSYFAETESNQIELRATGIATRTEVDLLHHFGSTLFKKRFSAKELHLVGHNARDYHIPMLGRRFLANGIALPAILNTQYLKPWEVPIEDTMEMWRFTERRAYINLVTLALTLGIGTSPADPETDAPITTSDLLRLAELNSAERAMSNSAVYHNPTEDLRPMASTARLKAALVAQVWLRLRSLPALAPNQIRFV